MLHCYLIFVLLFTSIPNGSFLMCYECTTLFGDEECADDFEPEDIEKIECDGTDICYIHITPEISNFDEIWQRGCVDRFYCNKMDEWNEHCLTCEEDLCNQASKITLSTLFTIVIVFVKVL